jgi:hypothetical protein
MNIVIAGQNTDTEYSGGHYHALMLVQAFAHAVDNVSVWANNIPVFQNDSS